MYTNELFIKFCRERNIKDSTMKGYESALKKYTSFHDKTINYLLKEALKDEKKGFHLKKEKLKKDFLIIVIIY